MGAKVPENLTYIALLGRKGMLISGLGVLVITHI